MPLVSLSIVPESHSGIRRCLFSFITPDTIRHLVSFCCLVDTSGDFLQIYLCMSEKFCNFAAQNCFEMRKLFTLIVSMACMSMINAAIVEGECGTGLAWSLNTQDSTLTISGAGAMDDYYSYRKSPWDYYYSYIAYLSLPEGLTKIGNRAFFACRNLKSVSFPNSLVSTGNESFKYCTKLSAVTFGNSFGTIGTRSFEGCTELVTLENLNYVHVVSSYAFSECVKLDSLEFSQVTSIGDYAFYKCSGLSDIILASSLNGIGAHAFGFCTKLTTMDIPANVTNIGENAFECCSTMTAVTLPPDILYITTGTFNTCSALSTIVIPDKVVSLGSNAFAGCSSLADIELGMNLSNIGDYAFYNCRGLTSIVIPEKVTYISSTAFKDCTNLASIVWNAKHAADAQYTYPQFGGDKSKVTSFVFGDSVEYIPASLCYNMTGLTSVSIPDSVNSTGDYAFSLCNNLTTVSIGTNIATLGRYSFPNTVTQLTVKAVIPASGGIECGINPAICTLYVPQESVETYSNTLWWEDFFDIQPIPNSGTGVESVAQEVPQAIKVVRDGQLLIERDGIIFNALGNQVR